MQQRQTGEASREEGRLLERGVEENPEQPEQQVRGQTLSAPARLTRADAAALPRAVSQSRWAEAAV